MQIPPLPKISKFSKNKHISHIRHTFFGLTKICLLWVGTVISRKHLRFPRHNLSRWTWTHSLNKYSLSPWPTYKHLCDKWTFPISCAWGSWNSPSTIFRPLQVFPVPRCEHVRPIYRGSKTKCYFIWTQIHEAEVAFWRDIPSHEKIPHPQKFLSPKNPDKDPQILKNPKSPGI